MTRPIQINAELMSVIAHELKGCLVPIISSLELLLDDKRLTKDQKEKIIDCLDYAWKERDLVDNMRDMTKLLARSYKLDVESTDMVAHLRETTSRLEPAVRRRGLSFRTSIAPDLPEVIVDRKRIQQVLSLMVSHAIKSTEKGGLTIKAFLVGNEVHVRVAYTGLNNEDQEKLFTSIFHIDNSEEWTRHGTGVGLALCKEIIELHEGRIWVESATADETALIFALPLSKE